MKLLYFIPLLFLSACFSAKIARKSEMQKAIIDLRQSNVKSSINDNKETQIYQGSIDTTIDIAGGSGSDTATFPKATWVISKANESLWTVPGMRNYKPIKAVKNVQNAHSEATYDPNTGKLILTLVVGDTSFKVAQNFTKTTISEHQTSNIDSSSKTKHQTKTGNKAQTTVSASAFQVPAMTWLYVLIAAIIFFILGRKTKK
jgi:hypothetical protein